jgi:predicted nucleic acid-binding protein
VKNYLLDSNVLIELFRNRNSTIIDHFKALAEQELFTSSVARAEVIHGAYRSTSVTKNLLIANTMLARINELLREPICSTKGRTRSWWGGHWFTRHHDRCNGIGT